MTQRKQYIETGTRLVFVKPAERAEMEEADRQYRASDEGRATCVVVQLPAHAPACATLGHEYNFGICLDCNQPDENHEPADGQIPGTYQIQKAAA